MIKENLRSPHIIEATYRIVTPMFIGDAQQEASGISPQSVKGALRFWWRVLNWGNFYKDTKNEVEALKKLHQEEGQLFGQTAEQANASAFTLRIDDSSIKYTKKTDWPQGGNDFSGYLGLGLWESGRRERGNFQPHRQYVEENQSFKVLLISKTLSEKQKKSLEDALLALGLWGGLGSRARRGFGAVAITQLNDKSYNFKTLADYQKTSSELLTQYRLTSIPELTPYTAFNAKSQLAIQEQSFSNARLAHKNLGEAFKDYRGQPSNLRGSIKRVFGMPYEGTASEKKARRASPLLFHIHPIGQQYVNAVLFMPADFYKTPDLDKPDFTVASGFLKQLKGITV